MCMFLKEILGNSNVAYFSHIASGSQAWRGKCNVIILPTYCGAVKAIDGFYKLT